MPRVEFVESNLVHRSFDAITELRNGSLKVVVKADFLLKLDCCAAHVLIFTVARKINGWRLELVGE
jgi:hypothetical protein